MLANPLFLGALISYLAAGISPALAAPTAPTDTASEVATPTDSLPAFHFNPLATPISDAAVEATPPQDLESRGVEDIFERQNQAHEISKRALRSDQVITIAGWSIIVGQYVVDQYAGTNWRFPSDGPSIGYIADQVASSMAHTIGNGEVWKNVGGGWSWHGQIWQDNYDFENIPYALVYSLTYQAIQGATDWISADNGFEIMVNDATKKLIFQLQVYPTIHQAVSNWHDEF